MLVSDQPRHGDGGGAVDHRNDSQLGVSVIEPHHATATDIATHGGGVGDIVSMDDTGTCRGLQRRRGCHVGVKNVPDTNAAGQARVPAFHTGQLDHE